jgi:hypothetical protein
VGELDGPTKATLAAAREELRRSVELAGDFPEAHAALGRTYLVEPKESLAPGIAELENAVRRLGPRPDLLLDLARLHDHAGDRERRDALVTRALGREAPALLARMDGAARFRERLEEADRLCRAGKPEEAAPVLEELSKSVSAEYRAPILEQLVRVRAAVARNAEVRRYNDAVALLNAQKLAEAREAFAALSAATADAGIGSDARAQVARIDEFLAKQAVTARTGSPPRAR